ncbi:hypothetical protein COCVIDRAFT_27829 [Bipolaris victoriae FI3]|uniref:Uncharacterized protein n=1 Tax=Bipolaris victoriae (strain FI3) TaxID=930091 RepID=W7EMS1_BIPV3|nr:hypothetical protein COCVIDRAFT_27829 [Bipolaris victoriae FI3]
MPAPHPDEIRRRLQVAEALEGGLDTSKLPLPVSHCHTNVSAKTFGDGPPRYYQQLQPQRHTLSSNLEVKNEPGSPEYASIRAAPLAADRPVFRYPVQAEISQPRKLILSAAANLQNVPVQRQGFYASFARRKNILVALLVTGTLILTFMQSWPLHLDWQPGLPIFPDGWKTNHLDTYTKLVTDIRLRVLELDVVDMVRTANTSTALAAEAEYQSAFYIYSNAFRSVQKASPRRRRTDALLFLLNAFDELERRVNLTIRLLDDAKVDTNRALNATRQHHKDQISSSSAYVSEATNPRKASPILQRPEQQIEAYKSRITELAEAIASIGTLQIVIDNQGMKWKKFQFELQRIRVVVCTWQEARRLATVREYEAMVSQFCRATLEVIGSLYIPLCLG